MTARLIVFRRPIAVCVFAVLVCCRGLSAEEKLAPADVKFFEDRIRPVLIEHCYSCHNSVDTKEGDLAVDHKAALVKGGQTGPALVPGQPEKSLLLKVLRHEIEGQEMPQGDPKLKAAIIKDLEQWVKIGAPDPRDKPPTKADLEKLTSWESNLEKRKTWWSFQPIEAREPPKVDNPFWSVNPIDQFVLRELQEQDLAPSPRASRPVLLRRATFDLLGLPPTPEEIANFANDQDTDAWESVVDGLLASPHYGKQWGRHWLDVVRFGESNGFERNLIINNLWPFRDYVISSFNEDKPFDQFVREHLAGDVIAPGNPDVEIGAAFLVCGPYDNVGNQDPKQAAQIRANTIDEIIRATGETFLGITVGCARCHHHKFDPIGQRDYYALYATFAGVRHGEREISTPDDRRKRAEQLKPLQEKKAQLESRLEEIHAALAVRSKARASAVAQSWNRPKIERTGVEETFPPVKARFVRLIVEGGELNPADATGAKIDEFEVWTEESPSRNVALASAGAKARGESRTAEDFAEAYTADLTIDGRFGERWIAAGSTLTIEFSQPELVHRVFFSSDRTGAARGHSVAAFLSEYRIEVSHDGKKWITVADSHDRQPINEAHRAHRVRMAVIKERERTKIERLSGRLSRVIKRIDEVPNFPTWWVGRPSQPNGPFHVFVGGDPQRKGDSVAPSSFEVLKPLPGSFALPENTKEGQRRLALANWIVHPQNPLTARVIVNRIWHYHFGTGLVDTPSDFGKMGGTPSHPELLDYLAHRLITPEDQGGFGWRLKPLHRLIMTSETYRQSSAYNTQAAQKDADARFLWRFPPRRLAAEEIRDSMLFVSGSLDETRGGPGFRLYQYLQDNVATYVPLDVHPPETYRRSVYHQNARATEVDLMTDFDAPDPAFAAPRRTATVTPLQALTMMNHQFPLDMANAWAKKLADSQVETPAQIRRAFLQAYSREPDDEEQAACQEVVQQHGLKSLCRAIFNSNEFLFLR